MTFALKSLSAVAIVIMATTATNAQTYTGLFRTVSGNTTYHQFNRNGGAAAVYINQEDTTNPILRLSSGTAQANINVRFTVENNGNVGIGTTTPQAKLSVNGNIRAKEVKVETANWPDYVFHEDYVLPSLPDLEAYIKQHGRLPGMPSAQEAEAEGIDLGEMNRRLLEKVEELTIHTIRQQARIDELEYKINNQVKSRKR